MKMRVAGYNEPLPFFRVAHVDFYIEPEGIVAGPFTKGEVGFCEELATQINKAEAIREDNKRYLARIEELTAQCNKFYTLTNRMREAINDLYDQCDEIPHAADCDREQTGYCTCDRGLFNSVLVAYHTKFVVE